MKKQPLLAVLVVAAMAPGLASAETVETNSTIWTYTINDVTAKTVTLEGGSTVADTIDAHTIPEALIIDGETYTVSQIGAEAFRANLKLKGVLTIPDSVTFVGENAFTDCTGLTGISTLGGVTRFGTYVFNGCTNMGGSLPDLSKVTTLGAGLFQFCNKLTGEPRFNPALTEIPRRLFYFNWNSAGSITKLDIPRSVTSIGEKAFQNQHLLSGAWIKGPVTVAANQKYATVNANETFSGALSLKIVICGPNTKGSNLTAGTMLTSVTEGCKVLVPANGYWTGLTVGGANNEVIYYGAGEAFDISADETTMTLDATPTTEASLVKVLELAPLFKEHLGLNTRVNVTNTIEATAGTITASMLENIKFNSLLLTFAVKTQAALDSVLAAIPASPYPLLAIDPTGASEELTLPSDREVWVRLSGTGKYTPKIKGLVISYL